MAALFRDDDFDLPAADQPGEDVARKGIKIGCRKGLPAATRSQIDTYIWLQRTAARPAKKRLETKRLDGKQPTVDHRSAVNAPPGQIQMLRPNYVNPRTVLEHAEILADTRVAVQNPALPAPVVLSPIHVGYPRIGDGLQEFLALTTQCFIAERHA